MKKILFFAFALVASVLAFTSCENKNKVDNPLVGTWKCSINHGWSISYYTYVFGESDFSFTDQNDVDTKIDKGTYELNQGENSGVLHHQTVTFISEVQNETFPNEEDVRFRYEIKDKSLTLTIGPDGDILFEITLTKE